MKQKGFSLIELLIVIAIIGILVAIALPNLLDAKDRASQRSTIAGIRSWGTALGAYMTEKATFPPQPGTDLVSGIHNLLVPYAISALRDTDHWNHPLRYYTTVGEDSYTVRSYGKDGAPSSPPAVWFDYNGDLILADGIFVGLPS